MEFLKNGKWWSKKDKLNLYEEVKKYEKAYKIAEYI